MALHRRFGVVAVGIALAISLGGCKGALNRINVLQDGAPVDKTGDSGNTGSGGTTGTDGATDGATNPDGPVGVDGVIGADGGAEAIPDPGCPDGKHSCPGGCVADDDINTCGSSCTPCEPPTNGTATCDGRSCGGSCAPSKQLCLGACIDAAAVCAGMCPPGQHACNGLCPSVTSTSFCGVACNSCAVPPSNGAAVCSNGSCTISCDNTFKNCPNTNLCVPNAGCCADADCVPTQPNTVGVCNGNTCSFPCATNAKMCAGACIPVTSCCGSTCVAPPSTVWTVGALVGVGAACPVGYSSTATTIRTGVSVGCASGCGCSPPVTGSCLVGLNMTFPFGTGSSTVFGEMQCTAAWLSPSDIATQIFANQPASFNACSNAPNACPCDGRVCPNCAPTGATAPLPVWQTSMNFCPIASGAATCTAGQCAPPAAKICVMAAGTQACPAGFTAMGSSGSWATGAISAAAACSCMGCGVASGESCANTLMTVGYGVCDPLMFNPPGTFLAGQFKGDGTSPVVNFVPDPNNQLGGWLAMELFGALAGSPTPGVCAAPQGVPSGAYTPTGAQTLCCL